jgi:hypothetical protein
MTPQTLVGPGSASTPGGQRREMAGALGLAALAALAILFAASRSWLVATVPRRPPFGPLRVALTGHAQYPALTGLAVVALLGVVLLLVTGSVVRRALGVLLVAVGGWSCGYGMRGLATPVPARLAELLGDRLAQSSGPAHLQRHPVWPVLTLLAAVLLVVCGSLVIARAGRWKLGLSARYAAPAAVAESGDPWRRLDRGEDPTVSDR